MSDSKLHTTERGTYYWEKYPTKFWIRLPWVYCDVDEECGHRHWEFEWRGFFGRRWRRRKVWIIKKYDLLEIIKTIKPTRSPLIEHLSNNVTQTFHPWNEEEQTNKPTKRRKR